MEALIHDNLNKIFKKSCEIRFSRYKTWRRTRKRNECILCLYVSILAERKEYLRYCYTAILLENENGVFYLLKVKNFYHTRRENVKVWF